MFKSGDAPACQLECGHQKGGRFFCWACDVDGHLTNDVAHSLNSKTVSLKDRIDSALQTTAGRKGVKENLTNFYVELCREDLILELQEREVNDFYIHIRIVNYYIRNKLLY